MLKTGSKQELDQQTERDQTKRDQRKMVRYQYVGKIGPYTGKRLFEILANLKNNGQGRLIQRLSELKKNKTGKDNFYKIVKAVPQMDSDLAFGEAWVEQVKDGKKVPFLIKLKSTIPDYKLIMKIDEHRFTSKDYPIYGQTEEDTMYIDKYFKVPPVMAEFLNKHHKRDKLCLLRYGLDRTKDGYDNQTVTDFKLPYVYEWDEYQKLCKKVYKDE